MKRSWEELEQIAGIQRNVRAARTQRDVENLTRKKLRANRRWRAYFHRIRP